MFYLCKSDMEYDSMRDRIFVLLKEQKLTQKELAEKLNVSPQTITDWKKKKSNSFMGMLGKLSSALQTTPAWLYAGTGQKYMTAQERAERDELILQAIEANNEKNRQDAISEMKAGFENLKKHDLLPVLISEHPDFVENAAQLLGTTPRELLDVDSLEFFQKKVFKTSFPSTRIPVLGTIPAGIPLEAIEDILDWEEIPAAWGSGDRQYFGLRVRGDSMYPRYLEGDTVILRKETTCESGDDCAVLVNGDAATLKQVMIRGDGSLELRPTNPAYPPRIYSPAEIESFPVQIIGVVVELRRKIK